ncbi:hypothetical protein OfM2_06250 [Lactovum odontotermitis]
MENVNVKIDRPIGFVHHGAAYPLNYGFVPGLFIGVTTMRPSGLRQRRAKALLRKKSQSA